MLPLPQRVKFIPLENEVIILYQRDDKFWYDELGTIWASVDHALSMDEETRAGIGIFSIDGFEREVSFHDAAYSMPVYQAFHTREEADLVLKKHMKGSYWQLPFYWLSRLFGRFFWENKRTR